MRSFQGRLSGSPNLLSRARIASCPSTQPCLGQRFVSLRTEPSRRPSRMVLSDQVHKSPTQERRGRPTKGGEWAGPFGGMNRRSANLGPDRRRQAAPDSRTKAKESRHSTPSAKRYGYTEDSDDRKALKMQRALATVSYSRRNTIKDRMATYESFDDFDLSPEVKQGVLGELFKNLKEIKPTPVQRLAIPAMLGQKRAGQGKEATSEMKSFLLAAETGSGKTLAYLLPAINSLKETEASDPDIAAYNERYKLEKEIQSKRMGAGKAKPFDEPHPTMARPKVVILVPTSELASQVHRVAKTLSHVIKFKSDMLSSDLKPQQIQRNLYGNKGIDLIISTPHLLASMANSDPNVLSRVTHLIVDEADSLLDRSFSSVTTSVIERAMPSLKQLVCCSATIPRKLNNYLATNYPKMVRITTPNLHAIPRRVQLGVIDVSKEPYRNNKDVACADMLFSIGRAANDHEGLNKDEVDVKRILVFVNEREKTEELAEFLREKYKIDAEALHRDTTQKRHDEILQMFTTAETMTIPKPDPTRRRKLDNVKVLVVTDIASRGIDTLAVRHVILYDVPHTTIDFIHRLGRAGRMGRRGRGIVLVGNDDRKDVVAEVKKSMFMGQALI